MKYDAIYSYDDKMIPRYLYIYKFEDNIKITQRSLLDNMIMRLGLTYDDPDAILIIKAFFEYNPAKRKTYDSYVRNYIAKKKNPYIKSCKVEVDFVKYNEYDYYLKTLIRK